MKFFILFLSAIIFMQVDVLAQTQRAAISLRGTVQSVTIVKTTPSSAFIDIKLKMEFVNTGSQPIIFLKRDPLFVGAVLARDPTDFQTGNVLAADGAWPSNDIAPEWATLRANLDQPTPPSSEIRVLMPNESWWLEASVGVDVPTDSKKYTSSRKKESLATIQQLSTVWLRVVCEVWPWNVEPLNADRNQLKFGHALQERWKEKGVLWLDEVYSEPIMMDVKTATVRSQPLPVNEQPKVLFPAIRDDVIEYNSNKVGFIDNTGKLIIDFKFYSASPFSEGLAHVKLTRDSKEGYINTSGQFVIEPQFERAFPFIEGRAQVRVDGQWRFINREGKLLTPSFNEASNFREGLAAVRTDDKWGYINRDGKMVIAPRFEQANDFSEGLAAVIKDGMLGYIDKLGNWVIPRRFEPMRSLTDALSLPNFSNGLAVIQYHNRYGYIDKTGHFAVEPRFERAERFSAGLAVVKQNEKAGYICQQGPIVIAAQFEEARAFSEGLAGVKIKGKWGFINLSGELIIPAQFDTVMPFKDGLAKVTAGSISGYINNRGEYLWVSTQNKSFAKGLLD